MKRFILFYKSSMKLNIVLLCLLPQFPVIAQNSVSNNVLGNGGGLTAATEFKITGTLGQAVVGYTGSSNYSFTSGFWQEILGEPTVIQPLTGNNGFRLDQNFPNPFSTITTIRFAVPVNTSVSIRLYDTFGKEIATIVNALYTAGEYSVGFNPGNIAPGLYFYRFEGKGFSISRKLTVIK